MNKILVAATAVALAVSASAQTNQVLSRNAVGYQRIDLPANEFEFVTMQFNQLDGSPSVVSNILPVASNGTQFILWDVATSTYIPIGRAKGSWGTPGTTAVARGSAFFLRGAAIPQTLYVMGEVPDRMTATQTVSLVYPGFTAKASGYPVSTFWTNTQISQVLSNGDQFIRWDNTTDAYIPVGKSKGSWGSATNAVLKPGEGFYIRKISLGTNVWTEAKPYTWP